MSNLQSSGRGGAGNIVDSSKAQPQIEPEKDLQTPTLKSSVVTTGRGGSGNMAQNTDPEETRKLQDVEPVIRRLSSSATATGRGGRGNIIKGGESEEQAVEDEADPKNDPASKKESWAEKSKRKLFGKKSGERTSD